MLKTYLKAAWRSLRSNKSYFLINIVGLAISITACILIGLTVYNEIGFDKDIPNGTRLYRLNEYTHYKGTNSQLSAAIGLPIGPFLKSRYNEIENYVRVEPATPDIFPCAGLEYNSRRIRNGRLVCTDTSFVDLFGADILEGGREDFLRARNSIVLTKSMAYQLFGNAPALHQLIALKVGDTITHWVEVCNVIKDFPPNSHLQVDGLLPIPDMDKDTIWSFKVMMGPTYLRLRPGVDKEALQTRLTNAMHEIVPQVDLRLQPLEDLHAGSTNIIYDFFNYKKTDRKYIDIFIIIGLAIFIIACCNFINLNIAQAAYRGREIAVKKIMGAGRPHIILQVLAETFLAASIAMLLALVLASLFLPYLGSILDRRLTIASLYQWPFIGMYGVIVLLITLLAGLYPALLISSSQIMRTMKNKILFAGSRTSLRHVLVTGQFSVALIFTISLVIFLQQIRFLERKDLGYSYERVIKVPVEPPFGTKLDSFRLEISKIKGVTDITHGFMELGGSGFLSGMEYQSPGGEKKHMSVFFENAAPNYPHFFGMKIIAGHDFAPHGSGDEYLINETLAREIGHANPIGKEVNLSEFPPGRIVGVVKDFNYSSLHRKVEPLLIGAVKDITCWPSQLYIKVSPTDPTVTMKEIDAALKTVSGADDWQLQFLDEHFKEAYNTEKQTGTMIALIGGLAISTACLGLLGLATFILIRRTKEISIRKVFGATATTVVRILSFEFVRLVLIAFVIASPIAWWLAYTWLQSFAYHITLCWWMFALPGLLAVAIAFVTVSFLVIRATGISPAKVLRTE